MSETLEEATVDTVDQGQAAAPAEGEAAEQSGAEEQGAEEQQPQETQGSEAADEHSGGQQDSGLSPELAERAARLNIGEEDLQSLGENAGMVLDKIETMSDANLAEIGRKLSDLKAEGEGAPEPEPKPEAGAEAESEGVSAEADEIVKSLEDAGYDDTVVGAFKAMASRVKELEGLGRQWRQAQEAQQAQEAESLKQKDAGEYSEWVDGLDEQKKALLADQKVRDSLRQTVAALDRGEYALTGKRLPMKELLGRAFRLAASDQLVAQARESGKKELMDEAKRRSNGHQMAPASQVKRQNGPASRDEAIEAIGNSLVDHGYVDADPASEVANVLRNV